MTIWQVFSIGIAFISLLISITTAYLAYFKPSQIKMFPGRILIVVAKAIILRKFGRTSEAIATFSRYGDMFAEKDPTAKQYSDTAQQFTIQLDNLGVKGGVYIYEIIKDGFANKKGLKVGDIIIKYNENNIIKMKDFIEAQKKNLTKDSVQLTYLRMSNTGIFERQTITVKTGSLSARLMPI